MTTAERTHLKRLKRKREIARRIACHGSVFNHILAHKHQHENKVRSKISLPNVVIPRFTPDKASQKKSMFQKIKNFFGKRV